MSLKTNFNKLGTYILESYGDETVFVVRITSDDVSGGTNYHTFNVVCLSQNIAYWGDGQSTFVSGTGTMTHTYTSPGDYVIRFVGNHSRCYHGAGTTASKVIEAIKMYSGMTIAAVAFQNCNHPLFHLRSGFQFPANATNLNSIFYGCSGDSFSLIKGLVFPAGATSATEFCRSPSGGAGFSIPSDFVIAPACVNLTRAFFGRVLTTSDISNMWPTWASGASVNLTSVFQKNYLVTGILPAGKLWERSDITWTPTTAFRDATSITNYNDIPTAWK